MIEFTNEQVQELQAIKDNLKKNCKDEKCKEFGIVEKDCFCFQLFVYLKELFYSHIPKEYWGLSLNTLSVTGLYKGIVKKYISNMDNAIKNGQGIVFSGVQRGIGKTSLMSIIGKWAIIKGHKPYYVIAQNIVDDRYSESHDIMERIEECDLLIMDELDKIMMREESNIPKQIENLLRSLLPNRKAILIGTNYCRQEIEEKFGITSFLDRYVKVLSMSGEDFSSKLSKSWEERLSKQNIDYNNEVIKKEAIKYFDNNRR